LCSEKLERIFAKKLILIIVSLESASLWLGRWRSSVSDGSTTLDRKRIYANPSSYPNTNPNPKAQ